MSNMQMRCESTKCSPVIGWWPEVLKLHLLPSVQRHKVWLTPTIRVPCSNAVKTRNGLKFAGVPQTGKPISAVSGPSSPYYEDMWRRYCCLTSFFPIVDTCLSCEDIAPQSCATVPRWLFFTVAHVSLQR